MTNFRSYAPIVISSILGAVLGFLLPGLGVGVGIALGAGAGVALASAPATHWSCHREHRTPSRKADQS